jgi:hypothetical protein
MSARVDTGNLRSDARPRVSRRSAADEEITVSQTAGRADTRGPDSIESEIEATRERLAATIDQLAYRASPKTIVRRELASLKSVYVDAAGRPRTDNILKTAGVVVGVVASFVLIRKVAS